MGGDSGESCAANSTNSEQSNSVCMFEGSCSGRRDKNSDALVFGVKICQNQLCDDLLQKKGGAKTTSLFEDYSGAYYIPTGGSKVPHCLL